MRTFTALDMVTAALLSRTAPRPWNPHVERLEAAGLFDPWAMYEDLVSYAERDRLGRSVTRLVDLCIEAMDRARMMREQRLVLTAPRFEARNEPPPVIRAPRWDYDSPNRGRAAQRRRDKPWHRR